MKYFLYFILLVPVHLFSKSTPDSLRTVDLQHKNLKVLPSNLEYLKIQTLHLGYNPLKNIPAELATAKNLKSLSINFNPQFDFETSVATIKQLKLEALSINNSNLMYLPLELGQIKTLKHLSLANNYIKDIPEYLFVFSDYNSLNFSGNMIGSLPKEISSQTDLTFLDISKNPCINNSSTYQNLLPLTLLKQLVVTGADDLPAGIWNLKTIEKLDISDGMFSRLQLSEESQKHHLIQLKATDCNQLDFSTLLPVLSCPTLKEIYLGGDKFTGFSNASLSSNLTHLSLSGENLSHFSLSGTLPNLEDLTLNFKSISCQTELINTLGKLSNLRAVNLSNSSLSAFPSQLNHLKNLETLNLAGNKLTSIKELFSMKQLVLLDVSMCGLLNTQIETLKKELPNTTIINNELYQNLPLENVLPKTESFSISAALTQTIVTKDGTEIMIPKNSLVYSNGKPAKEEVTVNFTPYYNLAEIAASGINMHYESGEISAPFSSAGMFKITASANGENLQLKKGSEIKVAFNSNDPNESYNYYMYDSIKRTWTQTGKDTITKIKVVKEEESNDSTQTDQTVLSKAPVAKYPIPKDFYKYHKISINWNLNRKNKPDGTFIIYSTYQKPDVAFDTTKQVNFFNEIKPLNKFTWNVDAVKFTNELKKITSKNKLFHQTSERRLFKFLRSRHLTSSTVTEMEVDFELLADKENDNFILKFYNSVDTISIHAYPAINNRNAGRVQKTIKKMYFDYEAIAKTRKHATQTRKRKFEVAYKNYKDNASVSRGMIGLVNRQNISYVQRRVVADSRIVRRVISMMTLGVLNCDRPIIIESPVEIKPYFVTTDGNEVSGGVYEVVDPKYNIVQSFYQPESIKVSKKTILTFVYNSGTSKQVYMGKLNTFDIANRHGRVKVTLSPMPSGITGGQLASSINLNQ